MAVNESYLSFVKGQLEIIGDFEVKKMFGGIGFFKEGNMFGMIGGDKLRLKVDDSNKADYEAHGMEAFMSSAKKKGMPYFEVPLAVLEDKDELKVWAEKSITIAKNAKK